MFIEYEEGTKHAPSNAERSETRDSFTDCGLLLTDEDVVIDIDHLSKESIKAMIDVFGIKTQTVWTERGAHLWFKKPANFRKRQDGVCQLGFEIEQHTKSSNPNGMTVKRNGVDRQIDNEGHKQYMPGIFTVANKKHPYKNLTGYSEGDGRNKELFAQRKALQGVQNWEKILNFINKWVFAEPLDDDEVQSICRDMDISANIDDKYWIATEIMEECKVVLYSGKKWWFRNGQYILDDGDEFLKRYIYGKCEGQPTNYIDEVLKQIGYRCQMIPGDTVFPIRFRNGILKDGEFIPYKNYTAFTPYFININYKADAKPVQIVDNYINELTSGDEDYKKELMEAIGFVMITDPERIRSLGRFFFFRGDGANGKGTLLEIMKNIYNPINCTNLSIKQLVDDRYKVTMIGKLANLGDDIEADAITNSELKVIKNISTADTVATRNMYRESKSAVFTCKLYFTTNSDIKSFEKGYAYKRRVRWMPMFNKVPKPDPNFISKVTTPEALEYWISLIVDGYKRLYKNQRWTHAAVVDEYNNQYHENNNICRQFVKSLDPDAEVVGKTIRELGEMFDAWCADDSKFSKKLCREALWEEYEIGIGVAGINGVTKRVFMKQSETKQTLSH